MRNLILIGSLLATLAFGITNSANARYCYTQCHANSCSTWCQ